MSKKEVVNIHKTPYKGMEPNKEYTLDELGLFKGEEV